MTETRIAALEAALLGLKRGELDDGPCWCPNSVSREHGWGSRDSHTDMCLAARAVLAQEGRPKTENPRDPRLRDIYVLLYALIYWRGYRSLRGIICPRDAAPENERPFAVSDEDYTRRVFGSHFWGEQ